MALNLAERGRGEPKHKEESKKGSIDFLEDPMTSSDKSG
jgi:hypothetical protein